MIAHSKIKRRFSRTYPDGDYRKIDSAKQSRHKHYEISHMSKILLRFGLRRKSSRVSSYDTKVRQSQGDTSRPDGGCSALTHFNEAQYVNHYDQQPNIQKFPGSTVRH
jgi:hypothetical protein